MKTIIVTGGSGFIGTNLVNYLIKKKYFVINIDKLTYSSNKFVNKQRNKKIISFLSLILIIKNYKKLLKSIDQNVYLI